jgi:hypothetical protein
MEGSRFGGVPPNPGVHHGNSQKTKLGQVNVDLAQLRIKNYWVCGSSAVTPSAHQYMQ